MGDHVAWMLVMRIKQGAEARARAVAEKMTAHALAEGGVGAYEWATSEAGDMLHLHERFVDSAAAADHIDQFNRNSAEQFLTVVEPVSITVYGNPDDRVRERLAPWGPVYLAPYCGFVRH